MVDSLKASLSSLQTLTWTIISVVIAIFIIEPTKSQVIVILGINLSIQHVLIAGPFIILLLTIYRRILIRNILEITKETKDDELFKQIKEIISTYPLIEFMRWKFRSDFEIFLLTLFQVFIDFIPGGAIVILPFFFDLYGIPIVKAHYYYSYICGILIILVHVRNYTLLRRIYESTTGIKIRTPD
jgi:hypothetical protein